MLPNPARHARHAFLACCLVAFACIVAPARAQSAALDPTLHAHLRDTVFEVVMRKPEADYVTYERALPMEQMPYSERTDPYISIGTAFAIGPNTYVSAAHVLEAGRITQYGEPAIRDADGKVHALDQVVKYSNEMDFIVFTLKSPVNDAVLEVNREPALNVPVYAAGNALGQGIVVRDGLLTSQTPEEVDGRWKWLRFSAAASPGNSGGPLLDAAGRVVGVVLRKSESENLNYAAPIALVLDAPPNLARFGGFVRYQLPVLDETEVERLDHPITLPLSFAGFSAATNRWSHALNESLQARLLAKHAAEVFPRGSGSARLLSQGTAGGSGLRLIQRAQDDTWQANVAGGSMSATLPRNGSVNIGHMAYSMFVRIRRPDDVEAKAFYGDSQLFMDYVLKALPIHRAVGPEQVRITSLGKALTESMHTDGYGRRWQVRTWKIAVLDTTIVSYALAVPGGYVAIMRGTPSVLEHDSNIDLKAMTDFTTVSMAGSLKRWREYLTMKALLPRNFEDIDIDFEYGRHFHYRSPRLDVSHDASLQQIADDSELTLDFAFFDDGGKVVWDVTGVSLDEGEAGEQSFAITRRIQPDPSLPDDVQAEWRKRLAGSHPYNGSVITDDGAVSVTSLYPLARVVPRTSSAATTPPRVLYELTYGNSEAAGDPATVKALVERWMDGLRVQER